LTRFYKVQGKNLLREREVDHHAKTNLVIIEREIIHQERDLPKLPDVMRGVILQEGVLLKATSDMTVQGHQRNILVIKGDKDLLRDPTEEILGPHQEGTKGTILAADLDHHQESRKNPPEKFTHISKSAKKSLMKMSVRFSGTASNGSPKPKPKSRMSSTNRNSEMSP
jgi:hypothetical protein